MTWKVIIFPYISIPFARRNGSALERKNNNPFFISSLALPKCRPLLLSVELTRFWPDTSLVTCPSLVALRSQGSCSYSIKPSLLTPSLSTYCTYHTIHVVYVCIASLAVLFVFSYGYLCFSSKIVNAFRSIGSDSLIFLWCLGNSRYSLSVSW